MEPERLAPAFGDEASLDDPGDRPGHGLARREVRVAELALRLRIVEVGPFSGELVRLAAVDHGPRAGEPARQLEDGGEGAHGRHRETDGRRAETRQLGRQVEELL